MTPKEAVENGMQFHVDDKIGKQLTAVDGVNPLYTTAHACKALSEEWENLTDEQWAILKESNNVCIIS